MIKWKDCVKRAMEKLGGKWIMRMGDQEGGDGWWRRQ